MAEVVLAACTNEYQVEVAQTDRAIVAKLALVLFSLVVDAFDR